MTFIRSNFLIWLGWALTLSLFAVTCGAQSSTTPQSEIDRAISKGAAFLATQQQKSGAIVDRGHENAMTALAIMALASVGHQPTDPSPEGAMMSKGLKYILGLIDRIKPDTSVHLTVHACMAMELCRSC
jgi:hypothetical protein